MHLRPSSCLNRIAVGLFIVLTLGLTLCAAPAAFAAWLSTGNAAADSSSRDEQPHSLAKDGVGGMYVSFAYTNSNLDSLAVQRLDGDGAKAWGSQGVRVNPGGNGASFAQLSPDSSGGVWAAWSDTRAGAIGVYVQRFNSAGVPQLAFGGVRIFPRSPQSLDIATTSAGELLLLFSSVNDSLFVQRVAANGTKEFGGDGLSIGINSDQFNAAAQIIADGEGGIVTYPRFIIPPGGASNTTQMWATRFNAAGTKQWGVNGTQVLALPGVTALRQRAAWDGTSLFCSWEHGGIPFGFFDAYPIRAQMLNGSGVAQWAANGVVVHTPVVGSLFFEPLVPVEHQLVADGLGGCYVAWFDPRNYNQPAPNTFLHGDDIYGQRLNSAGTSQWTANGAPIDSTAGGLDDMSACTDAANGMLLVYTDFLFGDGDEDVEMRRVNGAGAPAAIWTRILNSISNAEPASRERNAVMIPDGDGGAFAAWEDNRSTASALPDVYATRRAASNGNPFVPTITVLSPNGGEALTTQRPVDITWSSTLGSNVRIEFSNGGFVRTTISASTPDDGLFTWIPAVSGNALKIFVSDAADGSPVDSSNATFAMCRALSADNPYGSLTAANDLIEADFNEDGILDIVTATSAGAEVQFGLGAAGVGNGTFGSVVLVATPSAAQDVISEDFNDDGILDLAITTSSSGVQINRGNGAAGIGNGTFGSATLFGAGTTSRGIVSIDANEDGIRDLAIVNGVSTNVSILLGGGTAGVGTATFAAPVQYAVQSNPSRIVAADFNEDGITDLAITNTSSNSVSVLIGQGAAGIGSGTFAATVNYASGTSPLGLSTGDFNEDGIADLAVAHNSAASGVGVLLGNGAAGVGNGTFAAAANYSVGLALRDVKVIDLDGDGIADLAATQQTADAVYTFFGLGTSGTGNGTFLPGGLEYGGDGPSQLIVADFLEDGAPDVATGATASGNVTILSGFCPTPLATSLTLTAPNGGQFLQTGTAQTITWTKGAAVHTVDIELSRDGGLNWETIANDVTGTSYPWTVTPQATGTARVRVRDSQLQNRVDASNANFTIFVTPSLDLTSPNGGEVLAAFSTKLIQWNGNSGGNVRIELTSNNGATRSTVIASTPNSGQFGWNVPNQAGAGFRIRISLTSDGAVVDSSAALFAICARLDSVGTTPLGGPAVAMVSADFNDDGIMDIAGATGLSNVVVTLGGGIAGVGNGQFVGHTFFPAGSNVVALATGDLNRDGRLDLVAATDAGARVLLGNGTGSVGDGTFGAPALFTTGGDCNDVELADLNEDGILDIVAANINTLNIAVLIGQGINGTGNGTFAPRVLYAAKNDPSYLALNDFNEDGILDVAVSCTGKDALSVFLGQGSGGKGNGTLGPQSNVLTDVGPVNLLTGDLNQGNTADLVVLCQSGTIQSFVANGSGGIGNGTFTLSNTSPVEVGTMTDMKIGDFNGDDFPDLFVTNATGSKMTVYPNGSGPEFNAVGSVSLPSAPNSLVLGDFLEDGVLDMAFACATTLNPFTGVACGVSFNGTVTCTNPVGGIVLNPGNEANVSWIRGLSVNAVNVELSRDNGRNWESIGNNLTGDSFQWTVTRPAADTALVRISDSSLPSRSDVSDAFRILDPLLDAPEAPPLSAAFSRPYPNPVRGVARFEMALPRAADVTVEVYDISGGLVHTLARGPFAAGRHPLKWADNGSQQIAAGVYFVRARWEGFETVQRVVRLK